MQKEQLIDKKLLNKIEDMFDSQIWQRGKEYYLEGHVSDVVLENDIINAKCSGNSLYKLTFDLKISTITCTCPYIGNYCKHKAALIIWLKNNKVISKDDFKKSLLKKSKKELIEIIMNIKKEFPDTLNLYKNTNLSEENTIKLIKELWIRSQREYNSFIAKKKFIEEILFKKKNLKLFSLYLRKLTDIRDHFDPQQIEDEIIFPFLYEYDEKYTFTKAEIKKLEKEFSGYEYYFEDLENFE